MARRTRDQSNEQGPTSAIQLFDELLPSSIAAHPDKARAVNAVFVFKIGGDGGGEWTADMVSDPPKVVRGVQTGADCTIEVLNGDFMRMLANPAVGMELFMQGKLRVSGDPMLAMRLQKLFSLGQEMAEAPPPAVAAAGASSPTRVLITDIFKINGVPEHNFVEPEQARDLQLYLQTMGEGLLVEGPSGVGKTTVVEQALRTLGQWDRSTWLRALDPRDRDRLDEIVARDFPAGGHLIVDDFHHLDLRRQQEMARLIKLMADTSRRDAKVTLIGVNPIGHSLISSFPEVDGRFTRIVLTRQPDSKIDEMIRRGESAGNLSFLQRARFVEAARGSFIIAQRLCREAALKAGIHHAMPALTSIATEPAEITRKVQQDLRARFGAQLLAFASWDEIPPPRGACLLLLWHLRRSESGSVTLDDVRYRDQQQLGPAFDWLLSSNLSRLFEKDRSLSQFLYYNRDAGVLSAEDPQLAFYLNQLDWPAFARESGNRVERWDPEEGPIFRQRPPGSAETPRSVVTPAPLPPRPVPSTWALHLSDLHFSDAATVTLWYSQLAQDLRELSCDRLGAVFLSGDISNRAAPKEFEAAIAFLDQLRAEFSLSPSQIVLVPGNHDVSWVESKQAYRPRRRTDVTETLPQGTYFEDGNYLEVRDEEQYRRRFAPFADFYRKVCDAEYPLDYDAQATVHHLPEMNLVVLGLNSAWEIDHHFTDRASIHAGALSHALNQVRMTPAYQGCAKIALWHHPIHSGADDRIRDASFLERLAQAGFRLGMHGHIHKPQNDHFRYYRQEGGIELVGAGTFGAPTHEWVPGYPLQYQALEFKGDSVVVRMRRREEPSGAWKPAAYVLPGPGQEPRTFYEVSLRSGAAAER